MVSRSPARAIVIDGTLIAFGTSEIASSVCLEENGASANAGVLIAPSAGRRHGYGTTCNLQLSASEISYERGLVCESESLIY